jgi:hypothetical protein
VNLEVSCGDTEKLRILTKEPAVTASTKETADTRPVVPFDATTEMMMVDVEADGFRGPPTDRADTPLRHQHRLVFARLQAV